MTSMKTWFLALFACACVIACSELTPEEQASLAAKGYYEHLIHGEYELFLQGKDGLQDSSLQDDYRLQLIDNCHQFIRQQENAHRGIEEVRVVKATTEPDSLLRCTNVFMMLCFGDSTNEEVVVPMVQRDGRWFMK